MYTEWAQQHRLISTTVPQHSTTMYWLLGMQWSNLLMFHYYTPYSQTCRPVQHELKHVVYTAKATYLKWKAKWEYSTIIIILGESIIRSCIANCRHVVCKPLHSGVKLLISCGKHTLPRVLVWPSCTAKCRHTTGLLLGHHTAESEEREKGRERKRGGMEKREGEREEGKWVGRRDGEGGEST